MRPEAGRSRALKAKSKPVPAFKINDLHEDRCVEGANPSPMIGCPHPLPKKRPPRFPGAAFFRGSPLQVRMAWVRQLS